MARPPNGDRATVTSKGRGQAAAGGGGSCTTSSGPGDPGCPSPDPRAGSRPTGDAGFSAGDSPDCFGRRAARTASIGTPTSSAISDRATSSATRPATASRSRSSADSTPAIASARSAHACSAAVTPSTTRACRAANFARTRAAAPAVPCFPVLVMPTV